MTPGRFAAAGAAVLGLLALGSCGSSDDSKARAALRGLNVTVDTLRADHVGASGDRTHTPRRPACR